MTKVKAVLFDCDGVIIHSEMPLRLQIHEWLKEVKGYNMTAEELMTVLRGKNAKQVVEVLTERGINVPEGFEQTIITFVRAEYPQYTTRVDNIEEMLQALSNLPKVICSNGLAEVFAEAMRVKKLDQYFDGYFGRDNTGFSKPHPGVYLAGGEALGVDMSECLVVEDSPGSGIESAKASKAGIIVGFTGSGANRDELLKAGANYVIDDLIELPDLIESINA